jgi:predicted nucleotide-binding protein (sugar kinase/HSP70/actin superfamily)
MSDVIAESEGSLNMGDGTEPRDDDILELTEELYRARQAIAQLEAEKAALVQAWLKMSNFYRHDFRDAVEKALDDFMKKCGARIAFDAAKEASTKVI